MARPPDQPAGAPDAPPTAEADPGRRAVVLVVEGAVTPQMIAGLCARVRETLRDPAVGSITCDLSGVVAPDVTALDALARMQLVARRQGRSIRLAHARPEMRELLVLSGLTDVVASWRSRSPGAGGPGSRS